MPAMRRDGHELASPLLRFPVCPLGIARAAGDLVAAPAHATPAADGGVPAAEDTGARGEEGGDAAPEPVVADPAAAAPGCAGDTRARGADLQSAREAADRRLRAGA